MAMVRYAGVYAVQDDKEYGFSLVWPDGVPQPAMLAILTQHIRYLGVHAPLEFQEFSWDDRAEQQEEDSG